MIGEDYIKNHFFFECYVYHRGLHSFPTRRSSDLGAPGTTAGRRSSSTRPRTRSGRRSARRGAAPRATFRRRERSEEHTSELQSQSNLVCRLLLEKKNDGR